jgi:type I restriction enzyme S subunit
MSSAKVALSTVLKSLESGARPKGGVTTEGDIPSLGGEHVGQDGRIKTQGVKRISRAFYDRLKSGRIRPKDILIVKDGATTGKTAYVPDDFEFPEAAINEHVFRLEVDDTKAVPKYVAHFLQSTIGQSAILADFRGATVGGISRGFAARALILLPPLDEQRRIAAILDQAEELRAKRRAAIALLDQLPQAIFLEMFGDPVLNSSGHPQVQLAEVLDPNRGTKCGPFGSALKRHEYITDGVPVWQIDNVGQLRFDEEKALYVTPETFKNLSSYSVFDGDILITRAGTVGKICVAHPSVEHSMIGTNLIRVSLNTSLAHPDYVAFLLALFGPKLGSLRANAKEDAYSFMKTGVLRSLRIPLPPLGLQGQFAARVEAIHRAKATHQSALAELDALFASLQHQAFAVGGRLQEAVGAKT